MSSVVTVVLKPAGVTPVVVFPMLTVPVDLLPVEGLLGVVARRPFVTVAPMLKYTRFSCNNYNLVSLNIFWKRITMPKRLRI